MERNEISARVIDRLLRSRGDGRHSDHLSMDTWEWPQGVAAYAMLKEAGKTDNHALLDEIRSWYDRHILQGLPEKNINTTAPMLGLTLLYEMTRETQYLMVFREWAIAVMNTFPRTQEGGFQHITSDSVNAEQIWADTLFMTALFLHRAGKLLGAWELCDEAEYQLLLHIKYLHDAHTGLWYHGFSFEGRHYFANALWARGNSWFTIGALEYLEWTPEETIGKSLILETWKEQCRALMDVQDKQTGLWHTLLDQPDSYLETSASAGIAYGLLKGCRLELLGDEYREAAMRAVEGVLSRVEADGTVGGVSYGTPISQNLEDYRTVPVCPTAYGQGLVCLMLTEC